MSSIRKASESRLYF